MKIHKDTIPIDDMAHDYGPVGPIRRVACATKHSLAFWYEVGTPGDDPRVRLAVVATGEDWPENYCWVGTCSDPVRGYVWHLLKRNEP